LVWENKPEKAEQELDDNLPVLQEVKEKFVCGGGW